MGSGEPTPGIPAHRREADRALFLSDVRRAAAETPDERCSSEDTEAASAGPTPAVQPSRRRWLVVTSAVAVGGSIAAVSAAAAAGWLTPEHAQVPNVVRCYATTKDLGDQATFGEVSVVDSGGGLDTSVANAIAMCSDQWANGTLHTTAPYTRNSPPNTKAEVPDLIGCILPGGFLAIFPGNSSVCHKLNLPESLDTTTRSTP